MRRLVLILLFVSFVLWHFSSLLAHGKEAEGFFDKPASAQKIRLAPDKLNPKAKPMLSCFYFDGFVVKQIDRGEVGAEQLSILPIAAGQEKPACREANEADDVVIDAASWSGYFKGVKGAYVFFDAADGLNGGLGFAIFNASGAKLFEDSAKGIHSIELADGGLVLKYRRVFLAQCSLFAAQAACWEEIKRETSLSDASPPDCSAAYKREQKRTPARAEEIAADPTVIYYEVETVVSGGAEPTPVAGEISCAPAP
jgi:hypothetical protein